MNLVLEDYKQLYRKGNSAALDSMKKIFDQCNVKQKTFEAFTVALKPENSAKKVNNLTMAPDITAFDLNGKPSVYLT